MGVALVPTVAKFLFSQFNLTGAATIGAHTVALWDGIPVGIVWLLNLGHFITGGITIPRVSTS
jgi:ABC-type dipeptide/oligopeptide/nickel transport system permease component